MAIDETRWQVLLAEIIPDHIERSNIDWFPDLEMGQTSSWEYLKKAFQEEFKLLRDDNEIVAGIYNTKQWKNETVQAYNCRFKELLNKMEN